MFYRNVLFVMLLLMSVGVHADVEAPRIPFVGHEGPQEASSFQVNLLQDAWGFVPTPDDLDVKLRMAWDETGVYIWGTVLDDSVVEADGVTLILAPRVGATEGVYQEILPMDKSAGAYTVKHHVTWVQLGWEAKQGDTLGVQIHVVDEDKDGSSSRVYWYPQEYHERNPERLLAVTLSRKASAPVNARAHGSYDKHGQVLVQVMALAKESGARVKVRFGGETTNARLSLQDGHARAVVRMPLPDESATDIAVWVDGKPLQPVTLPDALEQRARLLFDIGIGPETYIFTGSQFPTCDFSEPGLANMLFGQYGVSTTFYDADYNRVSEARAPGRYAAVIHVHGDKGQEMTRFRTLYRAPKDILPLTVLMDGFPVTADFPQAIVEDGELEVKQARSIQQYFSRHYTLGLSTDQSLAVLMAGFHDAQREDAVADFTTDARARDRQWWLGLKRILYDPVSVMDVDFTCPRKRIAAPSTTLHSGTEIEAGMAPGTATAIETVLREWEADTDEGYTVAVARKGVVFFEGAYGEREGVPMTLETPSWIASISKLVSSTLMMMLVDQELVGLDDEVAKFLPALRYVEVERQLQIRDLYNHMNGFGLGYVYPGYYPDHWGDDFHDLEEIVAGYYPRLEVGKRLGYNGVGYALGGKVIEMVTDETLPVFAKNHLLDPLGMAGTVLDDGAARTTSTAGDMARFGQMLLNQGSYGKYEFFSEAGFSEMLPRSIQSLYGIDTHATWGVGMVWMGTPGLSKKAFGHGAASSSTFIVDPENELVIVMLRDRGGKNFGTYHPKFIEAIVAGLPKK